VSEMGRGLQYKLILSATLKSSWRLAHFLLLVIEEPVLTRFEARYDGWPVAAACFDAC
jgi:hypothetical protein